MDIQIEPGYQVGDKVKFNIEYLESYRDDLSKFNSRRKTKKHLSKIDPYKNIFSIIRVGKCDLSYDGKVFLSNEQLVGVISVNDNISLLKNQIRSKKLYT